MWDVKGGDTVPSWDYPGKGEETRESQDAWTRGGGYIVPSWDRGSN